jgi:DNA-binding transcriptional regulator YdaS (Cro superfamily)
MSIMKPSTIATSAAVAIAAVVGVTSVAVSQVGKPQTVQQGTEAAPADSKATDRTASGPDVRVDAPHTSVGVGKDTGKVRVRAPHTDVKVDPDRGQVRVKAPYVDLNIRW